MIYCSKGEHAKLIKSGIAYLIVANTAKQKDIL